MRGESLAAATDASRRFSQSTLAEELGLREEVKEAELLSAMDWLLAHQERIE